jgi:hypothetical protein
VPFSTRTVVALAGRPSPEVTARADRGSGRTLTIRGAERVARAALVGARRDRQLQPTVVNGNPGAIVFEAGQPVLLIAFTVVDGRIAEIDSYGDPDRLRALNLARRPPAGVQRPPQYDEPTVA